ncbi:MAG: glycosyltransferase family 1 protein [Pseudomonadota bacterium]|nr:glycosyltransferase family 1 protein [Pseudomonadota bacterium]
MQAEVSILDRTLAALPRLRVCVVTETYPPEVNGVALTVARCVEALRTRGHEVHLVRPRQPGETASEGDVLCAGMPVPGYAGLRMGLPAPGRLRQLWTAQRPDVVHVITEGPLGWSAMRTAQAMRIPVVSDFHTNFHSYGRHYGWGWLTSLIYRYLRNFHNAAQLSLVPTRAMRERLASDGFRRLDVVARGVDTELFRPERRDPALRAQWGLGDDDLAVLHVGRLAPEKNLPLLLEAFTALRARQPRARLVLVGDGPERAALAESHCQPLIAGVQRGIELARHYASADMFVFPSLTETFGNVTLEAMASGLAVLAYDYAAAAEHIEHGESGWLATYDDPASFVQGACWLATAGSERVAIGDTAARNACMLDWERVIDALERALVRTVQAETPMLQAPPLHRRSSVPSAGARRSG